jgi:hypothetical protein
LFRLVPVAFLVEENGKNRKEVGTAVARQKVEDEPARQKEERNAIAVSIRGLVRIISMSVSSSLVAAAETAGIVGTIRLRGTWVPPKPRTHFLDDRDNFETVHACLSPSLPT